MVDQGTTNVDARDAVLMGQTFTRHYTADGAKVAVDFVNRLS